MTSGSQRAWCRRAVVSETQGWVAMMSGQSKDDARQNKGRKDDHRSDEGDGRPQAMMADRTKVLRSTLATHRGRPVRSAAGEGVVSRRGADDEGVHSDDDKGSGLSGAEPGGHADSELPSALVRVKRADLGDPARA